jgi:LacI family transcriptional regulator
VHPSTVSRVLSGKYDHFNVSAQTRELIFKTVDEFQYVPNAMARSLRLKKTHTIGLVVPDILNPLFAGIVRSVEIACENNKYSFIICSSDESQDKELKLIEMLKSKSMDGLIVVPVQEHMDHFRELKNENFPFVFVVRCFENFEANAVVTDNFNDCYKAVEHLIKLGHRRIAYVNGRKNTFAMQGREKGYRAALAAYNMKVPAELIVGDGFTAESGYWAARELLQGSVLPTAVMVASNVVIVGVLEAIFEAGLVIPDDISVVSFADMRYAPYFSAPLTTISMPIEQIGKQALDLLLRQINFPDVHQYEKIVLSSKFVIRKSTHKPMGS